MKKDYIAFEMRITLLAKEDVVTTSDMEKAFNSTVKTGVRAVLG